MILLTPRDGWDRTHKALDAGWPVLRVMSCPPPLITCAESPEPLPPFISASFSGAAK